MQTHSRIRLAALATVAMLLASLAVETASAQKRQARRQTAAGGGEKQKAPTVAAALPAGKKLTANELSARIDAMVGARLKQENVPASGLATDEEFVRRVYLDIAGKIPTSEQALAFLESKDADKRAKLIDTLLDSKDFGRQLADIWQLLLLPRNSDNIRTRQWYPNLTKWMEEQFNKGASWDAIVKDVLTATGDVGKPGPAVYWIANPSADKVNDNVTRMFMGVQLECAQCHNHPFTHYKQNEYWAMAAFFLKVRPDGNPKAAVKNGGTVNIIETPRPFINKKKLPESAKIVPAKFLGEDAPDVKATDLLRPVLADWIVKPGNPYFAKAKANRVWGLLFGRGIVNPIDDMHDGNAPSHPTLLADLGNQFTVNNYDIKYLYRAICNSQAYQRSSKPHNGNQDAEPELWAKMPIKPLTPGQLFDSLQMLTGFGGKGFAPKAKNLGGKGPFNARDQFVAFFSAEDGADATEYHAGIPQVLRLMNAPQFNNAQALGAVMRQAKDRDEVVERLYLTVLSRRPTSEERTRALNFVRRNDASLREAYAGVLWALMNSSEFALNR